MRLIDADVYDSKLAEFQERLMDCPEILYETEKKYWKGVANARGILREQPTVEAELVVHCKHCKWEAGCKQAQHLGMDGYCSKGEVASNTIE